MKLLIDEEGRKILVKENKEIHTHQGVVKKQKLLHGKVVKTNIGKKFLVIEPSFVDLFERIKRGPQIITLKDAGIISAYTGVSSGWKIAEAGSGSGALTCYLANLVKPKGKVYSYEKRKDFLKIAKENVEKFGLSKFVVFKNKDISNISEKNLDMVVLDLPNPWEYIKQIEKALKIGGFLVIYVPTINQIIKAVDALENSSFKVFKVCEVIERDWKVGKATRPLNVILGHTAFLLFSRKLPL
ncbi:MAG: tRNA (adenine-N1)-methyltransferase [Nanoarchaeota archaeon]|nr:tRNA (adenine-N1)-methyltransferase [Nanoarchaeota archaeon]